MRYLYSLILYLISPLACIYLKKRGKKNPDYNYNWHERFGFRLKRKTEKPIIWIHAVSVGETRAAARLIYLLEQTYPNYQILITQMTPTGRATAKNLYPKAILHYIPYDLPHAVINFYNTFKPQIGLIMETEIWPNLIHYANKSNIPLLLINARLSNKSFESYKKVRYLIKPILNKFVAILCQDSLTKDNFIKLGFEKNIQITGSTKFDLIIDNRQVVLGKSLKESLKNRKVIIFASTRDGEEEVIINNIKNKNYLIIIVPRHPERFEIVEKILQEKNIKYLRRSDNQPITDEIQVLLGDTMGEMFMYYSISDIAAIGGSFNNFGGQNLIEPIFLNKPVILGPSIFNFTEIAQNALNEKCAIQVKNIEECFERADLLFEDEAKYTNLVNNCKLFSKRYQGASQKILDFIKNYI